MAKVYFVREEISIEVPVEPAFWRRRFRRGLRRMCLAEGREPVGNVW